MMELVSSDSMNVVRAENYERVNLCLGSFAEFAESQFPFLNFFLEMKIKPVDKLSRFSLEF